jgi:hypothetical protein
MNRALIFGIAIFFAVVGIALLGADNTAVAGHGCHGCNGGCYGGGCGGYGCHGCHGGGLFSRLFHGCHGNGGCHGYNNCCGYQESYCPPACCGYDGGYQGGGGHPKDAPGAESAPPAPPAAPAAPSAQRAPFGFRQVNFRR